jgi:hypothetical protein
MSNGRVRLILIILTTITRSPMFKKNHVPLTMASQKQMEANLNVVVLRVKKFKLISAMGILVIKGLLMVVIYYLLLKDEANRIN